MDLGVSDVELRLWSDSSAARGVLARRGCGKIRHLETESLRVQRAVRDKLVTVGTVPGKVNWADIGTKYIDAASAAKHLAYLKMKIIKAVDLRPLNSQL